MSLPDLTAILDRCWRLRADARRRLSRIGSARGVRRMMRDEAASSSWTTATSALHDRYRSTVPPAIGDVMVVCVSNRPGFLDAALRNVARQDRSDAELVLVTNSDEYATVDVHAAFAAHGLTDRARVLVTPSRSTLGACLNEALSMSDARYVAKFDDDDWYGERYLSDALRAHRYAGAGVVGKHSYYVELLPGGQRLLRFPEHEFSYTGTLAGGTLVLDRERIGPLQFDDVSVGEDRALLAACHRAGWSTFSADRFNYLQRRGDWNTWSVPHERLQSGSIVVDPESADHVVDR